MNKTLLKMGFFALLATLVMIETANATAILVVVKPGEVWVAADGFRSDEETWSQVCKVHNAFGGVLIKYGYVGDKLPNTDTDIEQLIAKSKSFEDFKLAAARVLVQHLSSELADVHPTAGDIANIQALGNFEAHNSAGLIFIGESSGHLYVENLDIHPRVDRDTTTIFSRFRFVIDTPDWTPVTQDPGWYVYPRSLSLPPDWGPAMLKQPDQLANLFLGTMERETPCPVGLPNTFLKITPSRPTPGKSYTELEMSTLNNIADVTILLSGACPTWAEVPIARPSRCTPSELDRESHGGVER